MRWRGRLRAALGGLLGLVLLGIACAPPAEDDGGARGRPGARAQGAAYGHTARLGAALSLTGSAAMSGLAQRNGITLAQDEINASRLLGGTRLEIVVKDDASDREQALAVFQSFVETGQMIGIMGPTQSGAALAVDPLAQQAGVPVLAISNTAGGITQIGDFIFRNCLSESQLTPRVIEAVRARVNVQKAALLYVDTDANRTGERGFKKALQDAGVQISAEEVFAPEDTDFGPELAEIAAAQPDALFITAPSHSAAAILIQARAEGLTGVPIVGSNAFNSTAVLHAAGPAAEGVIVGSAWSMANPLARNQQFIQSYRARFGADPDQFAAQAYSGVYILAAGIKDAHSFRDARALRDALERLVGVDTPLGKFSFNEAHDAAYSPIVQIVRDGQFQLF